MKQLWKVLAIAVLLFACLFIMSSCESKDDFRYSDGTLIYQKVEDGYEVVGIADEEVTNIKIPSLVNRKRVVGIGEYTFNGNSTLVSIDIPASVKYIGDYSIVNCEALESVTLPSDIERVGEMCFISCPSLKYTDYDNGRYVGNEQNPYLVIVNTTDRKITSCKVHNDCKVIGSAFSGHESLASVEIPEGVQVIDTYAFAACKSLREVEIPSSVRIIGSGAFNNCIKLTEVQIPNGVEVLEKGAFSNCSSLIRVELPNSLKIVEDNVFSYSNNLALNEYEGGGYIGNDNNPYMVLVQLIDKEITELKIHKDTKFIDVYKPFVARNAKISTISVPESNEYFKSINGTLYSKDGKTLLRYAPARVEELFEVPQNVQIIGDYAFYYSQFINNVSIPNTVQQIGKYAFTGCIALERINIPFGINVIEDGVFWECSSLISIEIPESVNVICDGAFSGCSALDSVKIPESVEIIESNAFHGCRTLKNVVVPDSVIKLGAAVFSNCNSLEEVVLGEGITKIDSLVFSDCTSLKKLTINGKITEIHWGAIENCAQLEQIIFNGTIDEWINIKKNWGNGNIWDSGTRNYKVICTDGSLDESNNVIE